MPTYDYVCEACGHELELFQSMSEAPKRKCPACGKLKLTRRIGGGAGILFKGSGFYQTDYRSSSYKKGEEKAKEATKPASDKPAESSPKKADKGGAGKTDGGKK
jgi:putative FmdB family regulatory protein